MARNEIKVGWMKQVSDCIRLACRECETMGYISEGRIEHRVDAKE